MPRNSTTNAGSRSAVKVSVTKQQRIQNLQAKAADLERRLNNSSKNNNNNNASSNNSSSQVNMLRMNLCEALSDILLLDAQSAATTDCVGRLWRNCFYARIGPARTKLAKDKKKKKSNVAKQEENLQIFLAEGVTLYDFLCDKLQYKLAGGGDDDDDAETETQDSMISGDTANNNTEGIVPCLHRLYIHLGDLFRYSSQFQKAEKAYSTAARLGPAFGHAYNQLAVVSQVKETNSSGSANANSSAAVSVYWYARALAASQEPFPTAASNLKRLYSNNREWLQKQQQATSSTDVVLAGSASRLFLAQFVDLQFRLSSSTGEDTSVNVAFYNHLCETTKSFQQLLQASAFGDSLLCKLVAIMAYSEDDKKGDASLLQAARTATLELGQCLAERVTTIIENKLSSSSSNNNNKAPSVRVLLPLLLLTEYLLDRHEISSSSSSTAGVEKERYDDAVSAFWKTIVQIYNQLQPLAQPLHKDDKPLKEYQFLRGFGPFDPFLKLYDDDSVAETGYLCDAVAAELLEVDPGGSSNSQLSGTQESSVRNSQTSNLSSSTTGQEDVGRIKIHRFVGLRAKLLQVLSSTVRVNSVNNSLEWVDHSMVGDEDDGGDDIVHMSDDDAENALNQNNNDAVMMDDEENKRKEDVLVYQQGGEGGPALLVPGALLQNRPFEAPVSKMTDDTTTSATNATPGDAMVGSAAVAGTSGQSMMQVSNLQQPSPVDTPNNVVLQGFVASPMAAAQSSSSGLYPGNGAVLPPPGFAQSLPPGLQQQQQQQQPGLGFALPGDTTMSSRVPTIGESYNLFGGPESLQTANPFAADTIPSFPLSSSGALNPHPQEMRQSDSAFLQNHDGATTTDGIPLLDSGFLNSLFMDDSPAGKPSTTKNPFAT